jgi:hypothetical protein
MAVISKRRLFTLWFWMGAPLAVGALVVAFATCVYFGLLASALAALWFWDMGETTCSRCSSYGTFGCGVQGKLIPLFWKRKSLASASQRRIRLHFFFDIFIVILVNATYVLYPVFLPVVLLWTAGAWWISFGPKRFHGLLFRLKAPPEASKSGRLSLPVVALPPSAEAEDRSHDCWS